MRPYMRVVAAILMTLGLLGTAYGVSAHGIPYGSSRHQKPLFPVTIRDDTGAVVTIAKRPDRLISLDPRDTETLFALNLERRIVADGGKADEGAFCCVKRFSYPKQWPSPWGADYPSRAKKLAHIEGGYDPAHPFDVELVVKKRPDLVLSLNSDESAIQKMRSLGLKVVVLDPHTFAGIEHDIKLVGRITGQVNQATVVLRAITGRFRTLKKRLAPVHSRPRVFYEIDDSSGSPYTACAGSFIDQMLSQAKAVNVAHNVQPCPKADPYPQMSTEALIKQNPQYILLGDSNYGTTAGQVKARNGWSLIDAVKHNRIYAFDDDLVSRAGPREIIGLEHVAKILHPGAFK